MAFLSQKLKYTLKRQKLSKKVALGGQLTSYSTLVVGLECNTICFEIVGKNVKMLNKKLPKPFNPGRCFFKGMIYLCVVHDEIYVFQA
jgi:hypothetical protein